MRGACRKGRGGGWQCCGQWRRGKSDSKFQPRTLSRRRQNKMMRFFSGEFSPAFPIDRGEILIGVQLAAQLDAVGRLSDKFSFVLLRLLPIGGLHARRAVRKREAHGQSTFADQWRLD